MRANGYFEDSWPDKIVDNFAQINVTSKKADIWNEYTVKNGNKQIRRDRLGRIDYRYYETRSRTLRSDAIIAFFKVLMIRLKIY